MGGEKKGRLCTPLGHAGAMPCLDSAEMDRVCVHSNAVKTACAPTKKEAREKMAGRGGLSAEWPPGLRALYREAC